MGTGESRSAGPGQAGPEARSSGISVTSFPSLRRAACPWSCLVFWSFRPADRDRHHPGDCCNPHRLRDRSGSTAECVPRAANRPGRIGGELRSRLAWPRGRSPGNPSVWTASEVQHLPRRPDRGEDL